MALFGKKKQAQAPEEENFISHLTELRDRIVRSLLVILVLFGCCFYVAPELMKFLAEPLQQALPAGSQAVFIAGEGAFFTLTKMSLLTAVLFSLPWVLYQAWAFVAPGLYAHERRFVGPLIVLSVIFLVIGIAFAYWFVLPVAYKFFFSFAEKTGAGVMQDLQRYWDFTLSIFFGFGLAFQVPVVEMLMIKLGMVSVDDLRQARRYVIVGAFVVAAVLTPPDVLSQFTLAIPLMLLYELGIFLGGFLSAHSRTTCRTIRRKRGRWCRPNRRPRRRRRRRNPLQLRSRICHSKLQRYPVALSLFRRDAGPHRSAANKTLPSMPSAGRRPAFDGFCQPRSVPPPLGGVSFGIVPLRGRQVRPCADADGQLDLVSVAQEAEAHRRSR